MKMPSPQHAEEEVTIPAPERWRWHSEALLSIRTRLSEQRQRHLREGAERLDRPGLHLGDAATDQSEQDISLALATAEQQAMYEVDAALDRIRRGNYGICEKSHEPIPEERLRAVPWTRYCEKVAEQLEPPHLHLGCLGSVQDGRLSFSREQQRAPDSVDFGGKEEDGGVPPERDSE